MARRTWTRALWGALLPLCLLGGATGCQTRLVGARTSDYDLPSGASSGIPFRLARPVFIITKPQGEGTNARKYELAVAYRSDPSAVYWVNVDPAMFHESKLTLTFDPSDQATDDDQSHGFLTALTEAGADKSSTFIEALGTFATKALGVHVLASANPAQFGADPLFNGLSFTSNGLAWENVGQVLEDLAIRSQRAAPFQGPNVAKQFLTKGFTLDQALALLPFLAEELRRVTAVDVGPLFELYKRCGHVKPLITELLALAVPLRVEDAARVTFIKTLLRLILGLLVPEKDEAFAVFTKANIRGRWHIYRQTVLLDLLAGRAKPSAERLLAEEMVYASVEMRALWNEKRRLESMLTPEEPLYEAKGPSAPASGFVGEVKAARARIDEIDTAVTTRVASVVLEEEKSSTSEEQITPLRKALATDWEGTKNCIDGDCYPRWVYYTGGRGADRATWLCNYLVRTAPLPLQQPAIDGELIVLLERSYPDREVRPPPGTAYLLGPEPYPAAPGPIWGPR